MRDYLKKLRYGWKGVTEFGVHSPFVFQLLTEAIYKPPRLRFRENCEWVERLCRFMKYDHIGISSRLQWRESFPQGQVASPQPHFELFIFASPSEALSQWEELSRKCVIYMDRPYANRTEKDALEQMLSLEAYTVGLDFFRGAFLFPRHGQQKETFRIRL